MSPKSASVLPLMRILPLENGDRLTHLECQRHYQALPQVKKAELIEGMVYMPLPLRIKAHGESQVHIMHWLGADKAATPGVGVADNPTVRLDPDNEP